MGKNLKINNLLKGSLVFILVFLYIYNPPIVFLPMNSGVIIGALFLVYYVCGFFIKLLVDKSIGLNKNIFWLYFSITLLICYCFLVIIINGTNEYQIIKDYLSFLLFFIPGAWGILQLCKKFNLLNDVINIIIYVNVIQSIIIICMLINVNTKEWIFMILRDGAIRAEKNMASGGFRFLGFSYGSTWDLSIVQSIGLMLLALKIKLSKAEITLKNALFFLLISASVFLTGRTGIFGLALAILIIISPRLSKEIPFVKAFKFTRKLISIIVPLFVLIIVLVPDNVLEIVDNSVIPWAFEMFINSSNNGKLETASSNEVKTMYFRPSFKTLIVGDGLYVNPRDNTRYYMDTDAGYMRDVLFYGMIGICLMVIIYLIIFYQIYNSIEIVISKSVINLFLLLLLLYYLFSNIKGDVFMGADMLIKYLFLLHAYFIIHKEKFKNESYC